MRVLTQISKKLIEIKIYKKNEEEKKEAELSIIKP